MTDEPETTEVPEGHVVLPELTPVELNALMGKDPLQLSNLDLAQIVKYHRKQRARRASGEKPEKTSGPETKVDLKSVLSTILGVPKPNAEPLKRRG